MNYGASHGRWSNPTEIPLTRPFVQHLKEMALEEDDFIAECHNFLNNDDSKCKWTQIMNLDGVCYTMNMIDSSDLFHQNMYESYNPL